MYQKYVASDIGAARYSETSADFYHAAQRHSSEYSTVHCHHRKNL